MTERLPPPLYLTGMIESSAPHHVGIAGHAPAPRCLIATTVVCPDDEDNTADALLVKGSCFYLTGLNLKTII